MAENNVPRNMGKKIADALKKQNIDEDNTILEETVNYEEQDRPVEESYQAPEFDTSSFDLNYQAPEFDPNAPTFTVDSSDIDENPELKISIDSDDEEEEFEMPNNINVLKRLIGQLPSGVPRQTGAQIIRQTIEALGIPMKSVLQDAQRVRDCLNGSIKDCSYTIQEYKSNIRNLEKQSAGYQKQLAKLNDIIGLFVYNEKK